MQKQFEVIYVIGNKTVIKQINAANVIEAAFFIKVANKKNKIKSITNQSMTIKELKKVR